MAETELDVREPEEEGQEVAELPVLPQEEGYEPGQWWRYCQLMQAIEET